MLASFVVPDFQIIVIVDCLSSSVCCKANNATDCKGNLTTMRQTPLIDDDEVGVGNRMVGQSSGL